MRKIIAATALLLVPFLVFAQEGGKKKAYYFYGEQCPHCQKVDEYFKTDGIYDKYDITKLEFSNPFNARLLLKFGDAFNDPNKGGVPAIAFGDKFIVGDQPIIDNFVREIEASDTAYELPDPDKISGAPKEGGQDQSRTVVPIEGAEKSADGAGASQPSGNKNKFLPVVLVALVVIGGGAIVLANKKNKKEE